MEANDLMLGDGRVGYLEQRDWNRARWAYEYANKFLPWLDMAGYVSFDADGHSWMSWNESGKNGTYCRSCGGWAGKVGNRQCSPAPVLPSSGVDEETLANLIHSTSVAHFGGLDPRVAPIIARAVAEFLKGEER